MKQIIINHGFSSNLRPEFSTISYIEIEDKPFATGGFGEVYHCKSFNGNPLTIPQVVKLFIDNSRGSAKQNYDTTLGLQKRINTKNIEYRTTTGKHIFNHLPTFKGIPQFSFEGEISGRKVLGFTSDNLVSMGFQDFEKIIQDSTQLQIYQQLPLENKMLLCHQLVNAFKILEEFNFIHADLKPGAIFINLDTVELALIDYDSGVIILNPNDDPLTWGAPNDWVAPEIWTQQGTLQSGEKVKVDLYSDRWSVTIGIHYLLTTFHPLFYLTELSPRVTTPYFSSPFKWPEVDKSAPYFQRQNESLYNAYVDWIKTALPQPIFNKLSYTINYGYRNPVARTNYYGWLAALTSIQAPPEIIYFKASRMSVISGVKSELSWKVKNAYQVELFPNLGVQTDLGKIDVKPVSPTTYVIKATGYFGKSEESLKINVFPIPVMETLFVPTPNFTSRIRFDTSRFTNPNFDLSITTEKLKLPSLKSVDKPEELKEIKPIKLPRLYFWGLSKKYQEIKKLIDPSV